MEDNKEKLLRIYRIVHQQGFIPVFTDDNSDSRRMVELCVSAGFGAIEYTLRRKDLDEMVPWIRRNFPDLILLVGSTIDSDMVIKRHNKQNESQLFTIGELAEMGVHGFVSLHGFGEETLHTYSSTHLLIPSAYTINEALRQFEAGAHFLKMIGSNLEFVKLCRSKPTFNYCPIFVTGGISLEVIPGAIEAGAVVIGTGLDIILKDIKTSAVEDEQIIDILEKYQQAARTAMDNKYPQFAENRAGSNLEWLNSLPHQHPF